MSRARPNSKVCRRLFPVSDAEEQAKIDNFNNILQEATDREILEKSNKYGYDFKLDRPLNGKYIWHENKTGNPAFEWIGVEKCEEDIKENEKVLPVQFMNENTPLHVRDETVGVIRKRRRDVEHKVGNTSAKRKVDFN